MDARGPARALLLGASAPLGELVSDALAEVGIEVHPSAPPTAPRPDVVLVYVERALSPWRALQWARDEAPGALVVLLVPFDDQRLLALATRAGADGCYALGQSLERLYALLARLLPHHAVRVT